MTRDNAIATFIMESPSQESSIENIKETKSGSIVFNSVIQEANELNRNKRIYTKEAIDGGIKHPYVLEKLAAKSWVGEENHPFDTKDNFKRFIDVDKTRATHRINRCGWNNNLLEAEVETLNNRIGKDMRELIKQEVAVSFSMRGFSPFVKELDGGITKISEGLNIICYDSVTIPSHQKAYMYANKGSQFHSARGKGLFEDGIVYDITETELRDLLRENNEHYYLVENSMLSDQLKLQATSVNMKSGSIEIHTDQGKAVSTLNKHTLDIFKRMF